LGTNYGIPNGGQWAPFKKVSPPWLKSLVTPLDLRDGLVQEGKSKPYKGESDPCVTFNES